MLLVEDDLEQQKLIRLRLGHERPHFELTCASTGQAAIAALDTQAFDVAIVDYALPDTDGLTLLESIQGRRNAPVTVMVTAFGDTAVAVRAMKLGAQDFLVKGDHLRRLPHTLDRAVRTGQLHQRLRAMSEIARAISSTLDVEAVFRTLGERLQRLVPYRCLLLKVRSPHGFDVRRIVPREHGGAVEVEVLEPIRAPADSPIHAVVDERRPRIVEHERDPLLAVEPRWAIVPVVARNTSIGALAVAVAEDEAFGEQDIELLEDLAAHMGIALQNARAYQELADARDELVRRENLQALGEMAAGVAHDFNNLLSAILGRAQMLRLRSEDAEVRRSVEVIEQAALDGARTVERIQEFAKAAPDSSDDASFVPVDVNAMVGVAVERSMSSVRTAGRPIELRLELGEGGHIRGNPSELRQVLTNLIFNAVDAMPEGGELRVSSGRDRTASTVWFAVRDDGVGMDRETAERIFHPFFSTKGSRGTGLGMSVSYGIVRRHGGTIEVESELGRGSTLRVVLPELPLEDRSGEAPPVEAPPSATEASRPRRARVLVIDDDDAVREVLADILRTGDHQVTEAPGGAEGLRIFGESSFDLVLTDLGMPSVNGWDVAAGVKRLRPGTPVGLITGWGASLDERQMRDFGVDLIVTKPFRYDDVLALVDAAVAAREERTDAR